MKVNRSLSVALLLAAALAAKVRAAEPLPPASEWVPAGALLAVEVTGASDILNLALNPERINAVALMPAMKAKKQADGLARLKQAVAYFETQVGTDWQTAAKTLLGGGATLAVYPDQSVLLVVDGRDPAMLEKTHQFFLAIAKGEAAKQDKLDRVTSGQYRGATGWTLGTNECHTLVGARLIMSNKTERLKSVIDLREDGGQSLASQAEYQAAKKAAGPDADALIMINMTALKQHPPVQKALSGIANPMGSLLLAGVAESLRQANTLTVAIDVSGQTVSARVVTDGKVAADSPAAFAHSEKPGGGALPNLKVPGFLAGLSFYRDLHAFYAAKDKLFPERTSQLIFFENMMGIFFSGRDLTDEVLAEAAPQIRLVVSRQQYDSSVGAPKVQIPAFAAVMRMKDPKKFSIVMEEAWQKAVGLVNFTRGQKAEPGLIIDRPTHAGTQFSVARFAAPKVEERSDADVRFNFNPALAMPDGYLILSSTEGLARDLIDAVKREASETAGALSEVHSLVELDAQSLASILSVNREPMIRNNMVQEGNSRGEAEIAIDTLRAVVEQIRQTRFEISEHQGATQASLVVELK